MFRLALFGVAVGLAVLTIRAVASPWWLLVPVALFIPLLQRHDRVIRARRDAARLISFYDRGLARIEDRWAGTGETGDRFRQDEHLYADDLDLFGDASLFQLLSQARTRAGEEALAAWLKHPAAAETIQRRHVAIDELRGALDLREALSLAGTEIRAGVHPDELLAWTTSPGVVAGTSRRLLIIAMTVALPTLLALAWVGSSMTLVIVAALARLVYQHIDGERIEAALRHADTAAHELDVLRPALDRLEREAFVSAPLRDLQDTLRRDGRRAGTAIRTLGRYAEMHDWTHNIVFMPIAAVLMWDSHVSWAVERWRAANGVHVAEWLRVVGEFEALSSLAAYAYEHPDDPFPRIAVGRAAADIPPVFIAQALGHPLLPSSQMVRNDLCLDASTRLIVVSGSNMSGKSTFLRSVGINAVLALAGAPVRAASLTVSVVTPGATLRIQDSLQQGRSRFFAEITRIRQLADLSRSSPVLFLLDELFHGTNSHDRLVGATGVLKDLLDRGAIGLITTHDLALTAITRDLGARATNMHFEDSFDGIDLHFDYRIKPGPVTRSNAIALMRAVGLDVRENPS